MDGKTPETLTRNHDSTGVSEPAPVHQPSSSGKPMPHFPDRRNVARVLRWVDQSQTFSRPDPVWSRSGSRQRLAVQLGVTDTSRRKDAFPAEHACDIPCPAVECGDARPAERDRPRESLLHSLRHQLKTANFCRFSSLLQAFTHYDREGKGSIDLEDLQTVCRQFQLPVGGSVLEDLMDYCDADRDGLISFVEFANFLSWKDMMPISREEEHLLTRERQSGTASADREETQPPPPPLPRQALVRPEDLEPINPAGSLKSVRTLVKQQAEPDQFRTMASVVGRRLQPCPGPAPSTDSHTCGVPPVVRRAGDMATAAGLLHPSVYHLHGVDEEQLLRPRSRKELSQIFRNVGVDLSEETFEKVWTLAAAGHQAGEVCVETFSRALKETQAQ